MKQLIQRISTQEDLNFLLTNRIPRITLTRFIGWWSQIQNPIIRDLSIGVWKLFSDLDLSEAKKTKFDSMHDCFVRELKPGARTIDMRQEILSSPCDAIVGECGSIDHTQVFQAKGFPYSLSSLMGFTPRTGELVESLKWDLRDLALDLQHVPPISCASRCNVDSCHSHFWGHMERQPHCAQTCGATFLQK